MQSSPPVRAWERPASPTNSQFSLDLGALGLDSHSETFSPPAPKRRDDRVFSEDIDGPSDFTDNMMHWMRDGTLQRSTMQSGKHALRSVKEQEEVQTEQNHVKSSRHDNAQSPTTTEPIASHHTPEHSPPKASPWVEPGSLGAVRQEPADEQASSEWNPYAHSETPLPPMHKQFLQPTVEDYYSELTPAPAPSAHAPSLRVVTNSARPLRVASPTQSEPTSPARASSDTLSPVRSPIGPRPQPTTVSSPSTIPQERRELDRQLQQLEARCRQLESVNGALRQALEEEQRIRRQEKVDHDRQVADDLRKRQAMERQQAESLQRIQAVQDELAAQRKQTEKLEATEAQWRPQLNDAPRSNMSEPSTPRLSAEESRLDLEQMVSSLKLQLQNERNNAEESSKAHDERLRSLKRESETARLRLESEISRLKASKWQTEERATSLEQQMLAMQAEQSAAPTLSETQEQMSRMRAQITQLQQQIRDEASAHDEEIRKLEVAHEERLKASEAHDDASRNELEAKQSMLNDAIVERDAAQDSVTAMQRELDSIRSQSVAAQAERESLQTQLNSARAEVARLTEEARKSAEVNAALDARISDAVRRREAYWRNRLAESQKERQIMAKALLRQWGREEVGINDPQPFAFRYELRQKAAGS